MFISVVLALAALLVWAVLLLGHHGFWRAMPRLEATTGELQEAPSIAVIIPARDEAETIEAALRSLFAQDYPGKLHLVVVDDQSRDRTAEIVDSLLPLADHHRTLERVAGTNRPAGWSGKLWAIKAGMNRLDTSSDAPNILLLTDADIQHDQANLTKLLKKMVNDDLDLDLDLVSVMVRLRNQSGWERLLIPPFVFFFQMLYPFPAVNRPDHNTAAAAGGCVLLRRDALEDAGGIEATKGELIDDVAIGRLIKGRPNGERRIWLGHAERTVSLRGYDGLSSIWQMVARTADTQLEHSPINLAGTVVGLIVVYLAAPFFVLSFPLHQDPILGLASFVAWLMMSITFIPTLRLYRASPLWALTLPVAALLYAGMTIDSARRFRQGKGGLWKGRTFNS